MVVGKFISPSGLEWRASVEEGANGEPYKVWFELGSEDTGFTVHDVAEHCGTFERAEAYAKCRLAAIQTQLNRG